MCKHSEILEFLLSNYSDNCLQDGKELNIGIEMDGPTFHYDKYKLLIM